MLVFQTRTSKELVKSLVLGLSNINTKDKTLLAELCRLPQMHFGERGRVPPVPPGNALTLLTRGAAYPMLALKVEYMLILSGFLQFYLAYRSLCPKSWTDRWDDQRGRSSTSYLIQRSAGLRVAK